MRHGKDDRKLDIFDVPQPKLTLVSVGNCGAEVSVMLASFLKGQDRKLFAENMSCRSLYDVSQSMLDARSIACDGHKRPSCRWALLDEVCQSYMQSGWLVALRGGRVSCGQYGFELGRQECGPDESARRRQGIERRLKVASHA